jgi:ribosome biogenesis GTPase A
MSILTSYCHRESKDIEKSIKVGVVGLPNVGRKSLINSLKKARGIETTTGKTFLNDTSYLRHLKKIV